MEREDAARISACVVTYNSCYEVFDALASLEAAALEMPMSVYVTDNASADGTCEWISKAFPFIRVIENSKNRGYGAAHNAVLPLLDSEYHLIMNPDIVFKPETLKRMADYLTDHPEAVIATPRVLNADGTEQRLPKQQPTLRYLAGGVLRRFGKVFDKWRAVYTGARMDLTRPAEVAFATGCFMLIRTRVFVKLKGFDESFFLYMEDSDLSRRAMNEGRIIYCPDCTVTHHWKRASHRNWRAGAAHIRSALRFFLKWGWRL
jgi:GT2 family glycosyltransferase